MIALVLTTKNNETKHCIHPKQKRQTEKDVLANKKELRLGLTALTEQKHFTDG